MAAPKIEKLLTPYNFTNKDNAGRIKYIVIHYVGALGGAEANYDNVDDLSGLTKLESLYLPMHTFGEDAMMYNIQGLAGMTAMRDLNIPGGVDDLTPPPKHASIALFVGFRRGKQ